ncbi:MAG TPA: hypothetical protein VIV40_04205 [Kofleriaceae bacterium]
MKRLAVAAVFVACQPGGTTSSHPVAPAKQVTLLDLVGSWRWVFRTEEAATSRVEAEQWQLRADPTAPTRLIGRYLRTVEVRSTDHIPFQCNQRLYYRQRAVYDVVAELQGNDFVVRETAYKAEPSPCDHGFRHMGTYRIEPRGNRLTLRWDKGSQTLWQTDGESSVLAEPPWTDKPEPTGPWRWQATSYDDDGNVRDEAEWWEITRRSDTRLDMSYRRRVTVRNPDGKPIACANAPSWTFDDAYVLSGQKEEEHWHFYELAVEPGDHPCLRATPKRALDEATGEQIGDFLVLEWRGKRRQILYRGE